MSGIESCFGLIFSKYNKRNEKVLFIGMNNQIDFSKFKRHNGVVYILWNETDTNVNIGGVSTATHGKYTQLTIGGSPSKAHIKRVMYYSQRISNTQLRNLTS